MSAMNPRTLALVDDDLEFSEYLTQFLQDHDITVTWFRESESLLSSENPFGFDFYLLDLMLPGVDGLSLLRILRRRSDAGVLVVSGKIGADVFDQVIRAGADMHLVKPLTFEQILLAIQAVFRRASQNQSRQQQQSWQLDASRMTLTAPTGVVIELSPTDLTVMQALQEVGNGILSREELGSRLGINSEQDPNLLHATIYRLKRRIEKATSELVPLESKSRVGYVFRAPLLKV